MVGLLAATGLLAAAFAPPAGAQSGDAYARVAGQPLDRFDGHRELGDRRFHVLTTTGHDLHTRIYDPNDTSSLPTNPAFSPTRAGAEPAMLAAALVPEELPDGQGMRSDGKEGVVTAGVGLACDANDGDDHPGVGNEVCLQYVHPGASAPAYKRLGTILHPEEDPPPDVALAVGDFLGDGYPQVAVAWNDAPDDPASLNLAFFRIDPETLEWVEFGERPEGITTVREGADFRGFEIAAGDALQLGREQLVLYTQAGGNGEDQRGVISLYDVRDDATTRVRHEAFDRIPHLDRSPVPGGNPAEIEDVDVPHQLVKVSLVTPRVNPTPRRLGSAQQSHYDQVLISYSSTENVILPNGDHYRDIIAVGFPDGKEAGDEGDVILRSAAGPRLAFLGSAPNNLGHGSLAEAGDLDGDGIGDLAGVTYDPATCTIDHEVIFGRAISEEPDDDEAGSAVRLWEIALNRGFTGALDLQSSSARDCKLSNVVVADARSLQDQVDDNAFLPNPDDPSNAAPGIHTVVEAKVGVLGGTETRYVVSSSMRKAVDDEDGRIVLEPVGDRPAFFRTHELPQSAARYRSDHVVLAATAWKGVYRLGKPDYTPVRTQEPLVILNASPTHFDIFDGEVFDPNFCYGDNLFAVPEVCFFKSTYTRTNTQQLEVSTEINDQWAVSTSASAGAGFGPAKVEATLETNVGRGFKKKGSASETYEVEVSATAKNTDQAYVIDKQYDILEYPLYGPDDDPEADGDEARIVTVRPVVTRRRWIDVNSLTSKVRTNHQPGNLLAYIKPEDIREVPFVAAGTRTFGEDEFQITPTSDFTYSLTHEKITESGQEASFEWGIGAGVSAEVDFIVNAKLEVKGEYKHEELRTSSTKVGEATRIEARLGQLDGTLGQMNYFVRPFSYFTPSGALVLDYAVEPEQTLAETGVPNFWDRYYGHFPDPTMILPNHQERERYGPRALTTDALQFRTRDMRFRELDGGDCLPETNPTYQPEAGDGVCVDVTLRNYSLAQTPVPAGTVVGFYAGDPDVGGKRIGEVELSAGIPARGSRKVAFKWQGVPAAYAGANQRIFARVDDDGELREIKEDNNKGFDTLRVKSGSGSEPYAPQQVFAAKQEDDAAAVFFSAPDGPLPQGAAFEVRAYRDGDPDPVGEPVVVPVDEEADAAHRYEVTVRVAEPGRYRFAVFTTDGGDAGPVSDPSEPIELQAGGPSAPRGVSVSGAVPPTLSWQRPEYTGTEGGEELELTRYVITFRDSSGEPTEVEAGASATSLPIRNLRCGETYTVTVVAENANGPGPASQPVEFTFSGPPPAPRSVSSTIDPESGDVSVMWDPSEESCGEVTGYVVRAQPAGAELEVPGAQTTATFEGLPLGSHQTFIVIARAGQASSSASEASAPVTVARQAQAPQASASAGGGSLALQCEPPADDGGAPVTGYVVRVTPDGNPAGGRIEGLPASARSFRFDGLEDGVEHIWSVTAVNPVGEGVPASGAATPVSAPGRQSASPPRAATARRRSPGRRRSAPAASRSRAT